MNSMLAAETAILLVLYARRMKTLVLVAVIIALTAFCAFEHDEFSRHFLLYYLMISVTEPAPTVRPPSRIAKRSCFSIAIGAMRFT